MIDSLQEQVDEQIKLIKTLKLETLKNMKSAQILKVILEKQIKIVDALRAFNESKMRDYFKLQFLKPEQPYNNRSFEISQITSNSDISNAINDLVHLSTTSSFDYSIKSLLSKIVSVDTNICELRSELDNLNFKSSQKLMSRKLSKDMNNKVHSTINLTNQKLSHTKFNPHKSFDFYVQNEYTDEIAMIYRKLHKSRREKEVIKF